VGIQLYVYWENMNEEGRRGKVKVDVGKELREVGSWWCTVSPTTSRDLCRKSYFGLFVILFMRDVLGHPRSWKRVV
jgi:hypothetical protein